MVIFKRFFSFYLERFSKFFAHYIFTSQRTKEKVAHLNIPRWEYFFFKGRKTRIGDKNIILEKLNFFLLKKNCNGTRCLTESFLTKKTWVAQLLGGNLSAGSCNHNSTFCNTRLFRQWRQKEMLPDSLHCRDQAWTTRSWWVFRILYFPL